MTRTIALTCLVAAALVAAGGERAAAAQRLVDVQPAANDTLPDVAVTLYERGRPVIYYNPTLMQRLGPQLAAFFMAHEYGHVAYGHGGGALTQPRDDISNLRQRQELEADCYATQLLAQNNSAAVEAALKFFARMGPFRFDNLHPSGSQRAAKILSCLPATDRASIEAGGGSDGLTP
jgi:Zn-dependent protease with chaperone function